MIRSFTDKSLKRLWEKGSAKGIDAKSKRKVQRILGYLDAATKAEDMDLPGLHFHQLKGKRKAQYAVTIRANWRITFEWQGEHALRINMEDYHGR